ncbi:UDP-N-acetylmuramoyl-L-alanine--D-glutamate ligase [Thiomicrorhabdus aquaedulcis]|uniref:UDP-N-acetylmuramoyl-L-alanine--D-glutamate ligase n=1 Tax=Thiomicrorhabdus aquaedulcis TaxID=2211106 RepID=UPI000FDA49DF|nr:UDP-N-acetylmuramoyl-L-alanine--D-glutamate ligase [Thiomicrorhabdus aquaedulcis]
MYLVAGLGMTGQSVLRYFEAQGETCLAFDTRADLDIGTLKNCFPSIEFAAGKLPSEWIDQFETIVLSPGIAQAEPWVASLRAAGKQVIGDIELFARAVGVPVIAITGSNGKSTVTTLTGLALKAAGYSVAVGGNIGAPVLDLLLDEVEYDIYVLELSSFQLETTYSLQTIAATVLNISEDHMDRYNELEDYIQAKTKVFENSELAVLPEGFSTQGLIHQAQIVYFGLGEEFVTSSQQYGITHINNQAWFVCGQTPIVAVACMALQGKHHQLNALAMMALCQPLNIDFKCFENVLSNFKGLAHRTQLTARFQDVDWINDSKGTNVGATLTAIESLGGQATGKLILLAGGVGKEADFSPLKPAMAQFGRHTILFGQDQQLLADALEDLPMTRVTTLEQAVELAGQLAQAGDCVLFSPACASFDQFKHYAHRGEVFGQYVQQFIARCEQTL